MSYGSYRLGIIGAGSIGNLHATAARDIGAQIAGFCDVIRPNAERSCEQFEGAVATDSLDELLNQPDMNAVVVATPNHLHKELVIAALRAGKDVLLEKPMAMNVAECDDIIDAMRAANRIVQLGFVSRWSETTVAAKQIIDAGRLGDIYHIKAAMYRRRGIPGLGHWFTDKSKSGGGALIDIGVHLIDLALHLTSRPTAQRVSCNATSTFGSPLSNYSFSEMWAGPPDFQGIFDVDDAAVALVRFENGMSLELNVAWAANLPQGSLKDGVVLLGDRGGCKLDVWGDELVITNEREGTLVDEDQELPPGDRWKNAWRHQHELFKQVVEDRKQPAATVEHGREVQAIVEAMYRSSQEQREVEIS